MFDIVRNPLLQESVCHLKYVLALTYFSPVRVTAQGGHSTAPTSTTHITSGSPYFS